jgi:hypothetical protein
MPVIGLAIPAIFDARESMDIGGLIAYGAAVPDGCRCVGIYAGRIPKGGKISLICRSCKQRNSNSSSTSKLQRRLASKSTATLFCCGA